LVIISVLSAEATEQAAAFYASIHPVPGVAIGQSKPKVVNIDVKTEQENKDQRPVQQILQTPLHVQDGSVYRWI